MARILIRNARLIDGRGGAPVPDAVLVAGDDGRIEYAGPAAGAPAATGAEVLDAGGRTLIPGLIDAHVHLSFDGAPDFAAEMAAMNAPVAALKAARNARRHLEAGITTVRDLGGYGFVTVDVARAQREGVVTGARILTAAEVLTITGGHGHFIGREVDSVDEIVKGVRSLVKGGADCIKVIGTGGVLTPNIGAQRRAFTVEQFRAAVEEAHEAGRRVATHAIGAAGIEAALTAGVDSIEHGCYLTEDALSLLKQQGSWLVATLVAPERILHGGEGVPDYAIAKSEEVHAAHEGSFARACEAGVRIASGTDAGTPFNPHGELWRELGLMHANGLPLGDVLRAATSEAAALLGLDDAGVLAPGFVADCVLLDGDPLSDVEAYKRVAAVVQGGRLMVDRRGE